MTTRKQGGGRDFTDKERRLKSNKDRTEGREKEVKKDREDETTKRGMQ